MMHAIMIVDDETLIRKGLANMIARSGQPFYVAGMAGSGVDAIEKIPQVKPDVIISDICMPDMDGLMLADYLRENHPEVRVRPSAEGPAPWQSCGR